METATPSRRERLRAETAREIKAIALRLMGEGGPDAISLRAIAREMGMTAGAIYGYYRTRDDLITTLIRELYTDLVDALFTARDKAKTPAKRILAWAEAFRVWALANPQGFRLIYGDPVPGYQPPPGGPAAEAEHRACAGLTSLVGDAWPLAAAAQPGTGHKWTDFDPELVTEFKMNYPGLPPAAVALSLRVWGRMHGLVALETYGHLRSQTSDPGKLYRAEMLDLLVSLRLD